MKIVSLHYGTTKEDFTIYHFDCNQKELFVKSKEKKKNFLLGQKFKMLLSIEILRPDVYIITSF